MADRDHRVDSADTLGAGFADTLGHADTLGPGIADAHWGDEFVGHIVAERYDVVSLLGRGGMGAVYLARDRALDELVALKLLNPSYGATPALADVLQREVKLARRVTHRNVARTFDFARHENRPFLTMEYIEGAPLSRLLAKQGRFSPTKAVPIIVSVCRGLQAAHDAGIVHRDIKPDNIMIGNDGRVAVTDFGLARGFVDDAKPPGHFSGTPRYMSPEQVQGRPASVRSDLFSLGVVAYELLSGARPWLGESPRAEAKARVDTDPTQLDEIQPDIPPQLSRVIMRAIARVPADRYPSAALLSGALLDSVPTAHNASAVVPGSSLVGRAVQPTDQRSTIAVLPFENRGEGSEAHLARGFSEDLVDALSELPELRVLSLGAATRAIESGTATRDPTDVGRQLDVDMVISGWLERAGDRVSVRVRATDVRDGIQRWSHKYDHPLSELLTVSARVAREISSGSIDGVDPRHSAMPTNDALDLYLRGREAYRVATRADVAVELFRQARRHAPQSPLINAGLAAALLRQWMMLNSDPGDLAREAAESAQRAIHVAPQLGEPYYAQALVRLHQGDVVGAVRGLRDAIARTPSFADAHGQLGAMLAEMGRMDEANKRLETARRLDPTLPNFLVEIRRDVLLRGEASELDSLVATTTSTDPAPLTALQGVRFCAYAGRLDDIRRLRESLKAQPLDTFGLNVVVIGLADFYLGDTTFEATVEALSVPMGATGVSARRYCFATQLKAEIAGFAGQPELALEAVADGDRRSLFDLLWLDRCTLLADMRALPGFDALRSRMAARADAAYDALWS